LLLAVVVVVVVELQVEQVLVGSVLERGYL
jgi:hypothetical protein